MAKKKATALHDPNSTTPQELLALDSAAAEKTFNRLSLDQQVRLVLAAPWQKRRDIIMLSENARELVQALPEQELYWTVRQSGVQDSLQLISLTSQEQLQFLFDMDCWRKDTLDTPAIVQWYRMLSKCNELKVLEWFHQADEEFLVASLKKLLRVRKIQQDTDISEEYEDMPAATLDGIYFFLFLEKEAYNTIMPLFNALYLNDRDMFYSIAEGMLWDSPAETEETAYGFKSRRLAEYGFPEQDEALSLYQVMPDAELARLAALASPGAAAAAPVAVQPRYGFASGDMPRFFMTVLGLVEDAEIYDTLQRGAITVSNKIIIADSLEVQSGEDTQRALAKAAGAISIALESFSAGDAQAALPIVTRVPAETLFRAGITMIMKLRKEFLEPPWHIGDRQLRESFFETPLGETLQGLAMPRPMFYEGLATAGATRFRAFMQLDDLQAAREALAACRELDTLLFGLLSIDPAWLFSDFISTTTLAEPAQLTAEAVLLTLLVRYGLSGQARLEPLTESLVRQFLSECFETNKSGAGQLKVAFREAASGFFASQYDGPPPQAIQAYLAGLLARFEETLSPLAAQKNIENRYIDKLLFRQAG